MKLALVLSWSAASIGAVAVLFAAVSAHRGSTASSVDTTNPALHRSRPSSEYAYFERAKVDEALSFAGKRMRSQWGSNEHDDVHVKSELVAPHVLRVVVDDWTGYSGDTVTLWLHDMGDGSLEAEAEVQWVKDVGPPFRGVRGEMSGSVKVDTLDWSGKRPIVVSFDLYSADDARKLWSDEGIVAVVR